ncbi:MAG: response regulator [Bacteroidota bacterium]
MKQLRILLANDAQDDCLLFKEVLDGFHFPVSFSTVSNGEQLLHILGKKKRLPHILFLDLNIPRKNGFDCLEEIKSNEKLKTLPVIIFSSSFDHDIVNMLYQKGAQCYIQKPSKYPKLKKAIHQALTLTLMGEFLQPEKEKFVISSIFI